MNTLQKYSFNLHVQSIKLHIKFACKMKLQYKGQTLASEVSPHESGKFIFNKELTIKDDQQPLEIIVVLNTQKGAKYIAGVIRLDPDQLAYQQGQLLVVPLHRCLDSTAVCQFRIDQVSMIKSPKRQTTDEKPRNLILRNQLSPLGGSPQHQNINFSTKSEFRFPIGHTSRKPKHSGSSFYNKQLKVHSRNNSHINPHSYKQEQVEHNFDIVDRNKVIEAEVYKQNYQKLKQKYKKQAQNAKHEQSLRLGLQERENTYKIEIKKSKLKLEQTQKLNNDQHLKIKQLQLELSGLKEKQLDWQYMKEEVSNKQHCIKILEQTMKTVCQDNQALKQLNNKTFESQQQKLREIKDQLSTTKSQYQDKLLEIQNQLRSQKQSVVQKQLQIELLEQKVQREQRLIQEIQNALQNKTIEFEICLRSQKQASSRQIKETNYNIEQKSSQNNRLTQQIISLKQKLQQMQNILSNKQLKNASQSQEITQLTQQIIHLNNIKHQHHTLCREYHLQVQHTTNLQQQLQKNARQSQTNLNDVRANFEQQIGYVKSLMKEMQSKYKGMQAKNRQIEKEYELKKNEHQRLLKNYESSQDKLKAVTEKVRNLEQKLSQQQKTIKVFNYQKKEHQSKNRNGQEALKIQLDTLKDQASTIIAQYNKEKKTVAELKKSNQQLLGQLSEAKFQCQALVDQKDTIDVTSKQKIKTLDETIKSKNRQISSLEQTVTHFQELQQQLSFKLQEAQIKILGCHQEIDQLTKTNLKNGEKIKYLESELTSKAESYHHSKQHNTTIQHKLTNINKQIDRLNLKIVELEGENNIKGKIIEHLKQESLSFKKDITNNLGVIEQSQKICDQLREQLKQSKQETLKAEMKYTSIKKQYDRFCGTLKITLSTLHEQLQLPEQIEKVEVLAVRQTNHCETSNSMISMDIINKITQNYHRIKSSMNKLQELNRLAQQQLQSKQLMHQNEIVRLNSYEAELLSVINKHEQELNFQSKNSQQVLNKLNKSMEQLREKLKQKQRLLNERKDNVEELTFMVSSLEMDNEANMDMHSRKQKSYLMKITELEQKISNLVGIQQTNEETIKYIEKSISEKQSSLEQCYRTIQDCEHTNHQLKDALQDQFLSNQEYKDNRKQLLSNIAQLQFKLRSSTAQRDKLKLEVSEQKHKMCNLQDLANNLIKQRQKMIKTQIQNEQIVNTLEVKAIESLKQLQSRENQINQHKQLINDLKQTKKNSEQTIKELQLKIQELDSTNKKLSDKINGYKIKHDDTVLELKTTTIKYEELCIESEKTINSLQQKLEKVRKQLQTTLIEYQQKLEEARSQKEELIAKIESNKQEFSDQQEKLYVINEECRKYHDKSEQLELQLDIQNNKNRDLSQKISTLQEDLTDKQEQLFAHANNIYELEQTMTYQLREKQEKYQELELQWQYKLNEQQQEDRQQLQMVSKQREKLKTEIIELEKQYEKYQEDCQERQASNKKSLQLLSQRLKRVEQEKLQLLGHKNSEIQKIQDINEKQFNKLKVNEGTIRKLQHKIQVLNNSLDKLTKQHQRKMEKSENKIESLQTQVNKLKMQLNSQHNSRNQFAKIHWEIEREVKRIFQRHYGHAIEGEDAKTCERLITVFRNVEEEVSTVLNLRIKSL